MTDEKIPFSTKSVTDKVTDVPVTDLSGYYIES